jgi:hypothetical protein
MAHNGDGSVTMTYVNLPGKYPMPDKVRLDLTCQADSGDGTFPAFVLDPSPGKTSLLGWHLYYATTVPGTTQPEAGWGLTIVDPDGWDVSAGSLAGRSASTPQRAYFTNTGVPVFDSKWTVQLSSNNVNSAQVTVRLTFEAN